jgi:hypothetical protein
MQFFWVKNGAVNNLYKFADEFYNSSPAFLTFLGNICISFERLRTL